MRAVWCSELSPNPVSLLLGEKNGCWQNTKKVQVFSCCFGEAIRGHLAKLAINGSAGSAGTSQISIHVWLSLFERNWLLDQLLKNGNVGNADLVISVFWHALRIQCFSGGFLHLPQSSVASFSQQLLWVYLMAQTSRCFVCFMLQTCCTNSPALKLCCLAE